MLALLLRQAGLLVRLEGFDTTTAEGRARERYRRAALSAVAAGSARLVGAAVMLVSVPLTLHYLGPSRYGLWMTIASGVALLNFADLGLGNGLLNLVSEANGADDHRAVQEYASSAFFLLLGVAAAVLVAFWLSYAHLPWARLYNASGPAAGEAAPATAALVVCFAAGLPLGVVERLRLGYQEGFASSLWSCAGSLLGLALLLAAVRGGAGLPWLVLAAAGSPVLAALLNGCVLFGLRRPWLLPRWRHFSAPVAGRLLRLGLLFFLLQAAVSLTYASDNLVAAHLLGAEAVTFYSVPNRLFGLVPVVLGMGLAPLWPAYAEAAARGDHAWVRRTLARSLAAALALSVPAALGLVVLGPRIIDLWVGPALRPSPALLAGFGVWAVLVCAGTAASFCLNGLGVIRVQLVCAAAMALLTLPAKLLLVGVVGLPGIIWSTVVGYTLCVALPLSLCLKAAVSRAGPGGGPGGPK